jgi:hypothetical protein
MANVSPRGQTENPIALRTGWIKLVDNDIWIEEVVLGTSLGCEDFADSNWVGCFNVRAVGEGGVAATSNWGITSQATTCFYFMHPRHSADFVDFLLLGRA